MPKASKLIFSSVIKPVVSEEKDKYLALASLDQLRKFIPEIDPKNTDLLPFSTDAYVANHVNRNGAVVGTEDALATADLFIYKFVDIEHKRDKIVGVILSAGFSEFGTNKPLTPEELKDTKKPFNVTLGGVIWKETSGQLANILEEVNDPTSENYLAVSSSFELSYDNYIIAALPKGKRLLEEATLIEDEGEIEKLHKKLKNFGGNGTLDSKTDLAIYIKEIVPEGIAFTTNPAAAVKGVAINAVEENEEEEEIDKTEASTLSEVGPQTNDTEKEENIEKISQLENLNVKENNGIMKITSLNDITDEALGAKTIVASSIATFVKEEIEKGATTWAQEKAEKENAIKASEQKYKTLEETHNKLTQDFEKLKASLDKIEADNAAREKQEKFNQRMAHLDNQFELTEEDRSVLASQVSAIENDEAFAAYEKNISILLKDKNKETIAANKERIKAAVTTIKPGTITASTEVAPTEVATTENAQEVVSEALATATPSTPAIAATSTPATSGSVFDRYKDAFEGENAIKVTLKK